ncbi:hypothetical protein CALCODRAFT_158660 [Calocera cornea HHB12733]|uniref:Uncharacterized protein n=1 Tax=Calocera cornea HHB12733 TaxID=1353952 RepID=A0A165I170_9BASI|nr:hypothetical protein CALCODRAFT_158660 [Calocera cornea HHB12733]
MVCPGPMSCDPFYGLRGTAPVMQRYVGRRNIYNRDISRTVSSITSPTFEAYSTTKMGDYYDNYRVIWKNNLPEPFKLFSASIDPPHAGDVPPPDFELLQDKEFSLKWNFPPSSRDPIGTGKTSGFLRFWSIPAIEGKPGSGLTFGVKLEREYDVGKPQPYKVLTYVGSPTGNPDSWTDVTKKFNPDYDFYVHGQGSLDVYKINIKKIIWPIVPTIMVTIEEIYVWASPGEGAAALNAPDVRPRYVQRWTNDTKNIAFELLDSVIVVPNCEKPSEVIRPEDGSSLCPGETAVLAWSCAIPEGNGYTFGSLRYWSDKTAPEGGHLIGVRIEQDFTAAAVEGKEGTPEPPRVLIYNGVPNLFTWTDVSKELSLKDSYTFHVEHDPEHTLGLDVTIENLHTFDFLRCGLGITIREHGCW